MALALQEINYPGVYHSLPVSTASRDVVPSTYAPKASRVFALECTPSTKELPVFSSSSVTSMILFMWFLNSRATQTVITRLMAESTISNPPCLHIKALTFSSSAFSVALALVEDTLAIESRTLWMPILPCSNSRISDLADSSGMTISTSTFSFEAVNCSKMVQIRVRYKGRSKVSSRATTLPIPLSLASKVCSRLSLPLASHPLLVVVGANMRY
mmetsp:Transcript_49257/g.131420  ORF Transcript_49257/g.131420 Transcript_49257/m.131420 type:complete len:214 (-) Transcript_49257:157-798(-)